MKRLNRIIITALITLMTLFVIGLLSIWPFPTKIPSFNEYSDYEEISYEEFNTTCIAPNNSLWNYEDRNSFESIINTNEDYKELFIKSSNLRCEDFVLPEINFAEKTLLGKYASGRGCKIDFIRKVYKDEDNKRIIYVIGVKETGGCKMLGSSMNWILIPKIPDDYKVEFVVK